MPTVIALGSGSGADAGRGARWQVMSVIEEALESTGSLCFLLALVVAVQAAVSRPAARLRVEA